jgi:hypothetical protein
VHFSKFGEFLLLLDAAKLLSTSGGEFMNFPQK